MKRSSHLMVLIAGIAFGFGLSYSSMIRPEVVLSFLRFEDFGLLWVLGCASGVTLVAYQFVPAILTKPILAREFGKHSASLSRNTLVGAAIFGVGWGIAGVCPGPVIAGLGAANWPLGISLVSIFAGAYVQGLFAK
ncbi:MAG: YeeE/YedE family protein [Pseudomonadales bacterium]|nr:YeeE/YedE family protein [Pseudomonadales bacterium]